MIRLLRIAIVMILFFSFSSIQRAGTPGLAAKDEQNPPVLGRFVVFEGFMRAT